MQREFRIFLTAMMFFTRIPCPSWTDHSQDYLNSASRYFPLIGWIVGAVAALVVAIGRHVLPLPLIVLLSMVATIWVTGAFHEDGFADVCDGFGGGWTKADILRIMKDSRTGAFGVIGIVLLMGLKFLSLIALPANMLPLILIAGHSLSRFASTSLLYTHAYVQEDALSKAKPLATRISATELIVAGVFGILPLLALVGMFAHALAIVVSLAAVWGIRWYLGRYFTRWIGGYTGDCLGTVQQVTEVVFYLTLVGMMSA
ncbi:adenosylcobinamide-GDP ribazoletransferase [candidate division KSB3 bacterium]|uniref:Adenosylcobinamide-GDP ribazoletransferase n=1 Tax=candidate division KSB3 bacterium TaxID=2044937 RepID=A0A9D5JYS2_9BACT|nr:adenosylcobinamide-GDP ribazoletransferase [candidate division KSB3 bacterium]MBD3326650.1 adenosylcobinamide-GDP ribazoletransferase [candidate division KSB3 bacterium]